MASLIVSCAAVAIALAALAHSILSSRSERDDRRAGLDLVRQQLEDERHRHDEQMTFEHERRLDDRRAELLAHQGGISGGDPNDVFDIAITNGGKSVARRVRLYIRGEVEETLTDPTPPIDVAAGDRQEWRLQIPQPIGRGQRTITLWATWDDGAGPHDEQLIELRTL